MRVVRVCIALGSNLGDRARNLQRATDALALSLRLVAASPVYETAPMYVEDQPPFLNAAVLAQTEVGPLALLRRLKQVEGEVGRAARERYGPREIDLDLIAYGALAYRFVDRGRTVLQVPHPRLPERLFVLQPLMDLDPEMQLPGLGTVQSVMATAETDARSVQRLDHVVLSL